MELLWQSCGNYRINNGRTLIKKADEEQECKTWIFLSFCFHCSPVSIETPCQWLWQYLHRYFIWLWVRYTSVCDVKWILRSTFFTIFIPTWSIKIKTLHFFHIFSPFRDQKQFLRKPTPSLCSSVPL